MSASALAGRSSERVRLMRYAVVGLASNLFLYGLYLLLVTFGADPKVAMTGTFALGVLQTFWANKAWTFGFAGASAPAFVKYMLLYVAGYALNLSLLLVFVDYYGFPHAAVQAAAIVLVAAGIYVGQRRWVFFDRSRSDLK